MNRREINDKMDCFLGSDGETAIVIHERDGELLRIEGENLTFEELVEDSDQLAEQDTIDGVDLDEHMDDLINGDFVDENSSEVYWRIEADDNYIETWAEEDQVVALDTRHEISSYGDSEEEAIEHLQEALKEYLVLKYIQKDEPVTVQEIEQSLNIGMRDLVEPLDSLLERGEIFEPQRDQLKIVPNE